MLARVENQGILTAPRYFFPLYRLDEGNAILLNAFSPFDNKLLKSLQTVAKFLKPGDPLRVALNRTGNGKSFGLDPVDCFGIRE